jgi:hypothetical protein
MEAAKTEIRYGNAIVRMHGTPNTETIKKAAEQYLRRVEQCRQRESREKSST